MIHILILQSQEVSEKWKIPWGHKNLEINSRLQDTLTLYGTEYNTLWGMLSEL